MRRAFVGFSSPVGYCYQAPAKKTLNDQNSSPSAVLSGGLGLVVLYDQIWFACESLCPPNMRNLSYVKFLDQEVSSLDLTREPLDEQVKNISSLLEAGRRYSEQEFDDDDRRLFKSLESDRAPYKDFGCDNHSRSMSFFNKQFSGNPDERNLALDLALVTRFRSLDLSIVLNQRTGASFGSKENFKAFSAAPQSSSALTEGVLRLSALHESADPMGAYRPIIEELRGDPLIKNFRKWMDSQSSRLDNQTIRMIESEVDQKINEFRMRADRHLVKGKPAGARTYEVFKDSVIKTIPGLSTAMKWQKGVGEEREANDLRWQAFISLSRQALKNSNE